MIDPVMVSVVAGSISLVTNVMFYNIRRLRCTHVKTLCCECDRELMTTEELRNDEIKNVLDNK